MLNTQIQPLLRQAFPTKLCKYKFPANSAFSLCNFCSSPHLVMDHLLHKQLTWLPCLTFPTGGGSNLISSDLSLLILSFPTYTVWVVLKCLSSSKMNFTKYLLHIRGSYLQCSFLLADWKSRSRGKRYQIKNKSSGLSLPYKKSQTNAL